MFTTGQPDSLSSSLHRTDTRTDRCGEDVTSVALTFHRPARQGERRGLELRESGAVTPARGPAPIPECQTRRAFRRGLTGVHIRPHAARRRELPPRARRVRRRPPGARIPSGLRGMQATAGARLATARRVPRTAGCRQLRGSGAIGPALQRHDRPRREDAGGLRVDPHGRQVGHRRARSRTNRQRQRSRGTHDPRAQPQGP